MDDAAVLRLIVERDHAGTAKAMRLGAISPMAASLLAAGSVDVFAAEALVDSDGRVTRSTGGLADAIAASWRVAKTGNATMGWIVPFADGVSVQYAAIPDGKDVTLVLAMHGAPTLPAADELVDEMTGLPSRRALLDAIARRITSAASDVSGATFAVLLVDVDGLRDVNDAVGRAAGDALLREVSARISASVRTGDIVARIGGDEFAILTGSVADERSALGVHLRLLHALSPPVELAETTIRPTVSVGIVLAARGDRTPQGLLDDANLAMRHAQGYGRNHASIYDRDMREVVTQNFLAAQDISGALEGDELVLYVQPIFTIDLQPAGAEALLRWQHPGRGLLEPGDFMSAVDDANLVLPVGEWVIDQVVRLAGSWSRHHDLSTYQVGMNVAPSHLMSGGLAATIKAALQRHDVNPKHVVVEITESEVLAARADVLATIESLRDLGVVIAIDDFGSGAAGITYLRDLPVDLVKLHGKLVPAKPGERDRVLVSGIVRMCDDLGMKVLLEGVETMEQLDLARACGVGYVQGYLLSRPVIAVAGRHLPVPDPALHDPEAPTVED